MKYFNKELNFYNKFLYNFSFCDKTKGIFYPVTSLDVLLEFSGIKVL